MTKEFVKNEQNLLSSKYGLHDITRGKKNFEAPLWRTTPPTHIYMGLLPSYTPHLFFDPHPLLYKSSAKNYLTLFTIMIYNIHKQTTNGGIMSTRGKEYKQNRKYDRDGNIVPKVKVPKMYKKNYRHQRNK